MPAPTVAPASGWALQATPTSDQYGIRRSEGSMEALVTYSH